MRKPREIALEALGPPMTAKVMTGNYAPVLPFTPQGFSVGALLPMILYLFRWGHRRGRGKFKEKFSDGKKPTISSVARVLAGHDRLAGFRSALGEAVLGDLLLTYCLENRRHAEGRDEQVQRIFATHYFASWVDLPESAGHLRGVPEAIVAILASQPNGQYLSAELARSRYPVGARVEKNRLLTSFGVGTVTAKPHESSFTSDQFDEAQDVAIDQILEIRLAQMCGERPQKATGKNEPGPIPNQLPAASQSAAIFREDFLTFVESYGDGKIPRLSFLPMLDAGIAIGLSSIVLSTAVVLDAWNETGRLPPPSEQAPLPIFIDCSGSAEPTLRDVSETSYDLARQRLGQVSLLLMYLRLLDFFVMSESDIERSAIPTPEPNPVARLNLLGSLAQGTHFESRDAEKFFRRQCRALADVLAREDEADARVAVLLDEASNRRHGQRLAEVLMSMIDLKSVTKDSTEVLSSALKVDDPQGLAKRRRIALRRAAGASERKSGDVTSFVLSNTALEYLVHRHVRRTGKGRKERSLSLPQFIDILRERYGYYIDRSPPNMQVSADLLLSNRRVLERRLRDLGLLAGVNDAENMKKLRARFAAEATEIETAA